MADLCEENELSLPKGNDENERCRSYIIAGNVTTLNCH